MSDPVPPRAEIVVDIAAIRHNVRVLGDLVSADAPVAMMVVVKADGYGHGMAEAARAARGAGAAWLGVATVDEALAVRASGDKGRLLCWLTTPGDDLAAVVAADVDVTAYSVAELTELAALSGSEVRPRVQLKVDTGLSRGGAPRGEWDDLFAEAGELERAGRVTITGIWSHFAASDEPEHPANDAQEGAFCDALAMAAAAGLEPEVRHLANSAATLTNPRAHYDLVRPGLAVFGLSPVPQLGGPGDFGLVPAMTLEASLATVKAVPGGRGVSYAHAYTTPTDTVLGIVPLGYADGIPRHASGHLPERPGGPVRVGTGGRARTLAVAGRVCMDQVVVDLGPGATEQAGDRVVLFGTGADGGPTAEDWARAAGTISYEITTRLGARVPRHHVDGDAGR